MKVKLVPPSVKAEPVSNAQVKLSLPSGNPKVNAIAENYVNASVNAFLSIGSLTFERKLLERNSLRDENQWLDKFIADYAQGTVFVYKGQSGNSIRVATLDLQAIMAFLDSVSVERKVALEDAEEVEI